jgi:hypothetical protein
MTLSIEPLLPGPDRRRFGPKIFKEALNFESVVIVRDQLTECLDELIQRSRVVCGPQFHILGKHSSKMTFLFFLTFNSILSPFASIVPAAPEGGAKKRNTDG